MTKISLYGSLAICLFVNGKCMLDLRHFVEHIPGLLDFLLFYVILNWSNASKCGLARGVSRDGLMD